MLIAIYILFVYFEGYGMHMGPGNKLFILIYTIIANSDHLRSKKSRDYKLIIR